MVFLTSMEGTVKWLFIKLNMSSFPDLVLTYPLKL